MTEHTDTTAEAAATADPSPLTEDSNAQPTGGPDPAGDAPSGATDLGPDGGPGAGAADAAPADAAPADAVAGDVALADAAPAPADAAPVDAAPVDAAPVDAAPVDAAPVDAAPADAAPADAAPADAAPADAAPADAAPADGVEAPKKKRRRRRKKKGEGALAEGTSGREPGVKEHGRDARHHDAAPFVHYLEGAGRGNARRHAFGVGEIVAGRVQRIDDGAVSIDLFGKTIAIADLLEPRELPPIPDAHADSAHPRVEPNQRGPEAHVGIDPHSDPDARADANGPAEMGAEPTAGAAPNVAEGTSAAEGISAGVTDAGDDPAVTLPPTQGSEAEEPAVVISRMVPISDAPPAGDGADAAAAPLSDVLAQAVAATGQTAYVADAGQDADAAEHATDGARQGAAADSAADDGAAGDEDADAPGAVDVIDYALLALLEPPTPAPEPPTIGEIYRGRIGAVAESGHVVIVNRIIDRKAAQSALEMARKAHHRVFGVVFGFNRGGFDVMLAGMRVFCPASGMALGNIEDPHEFVGKKLEFALAPPKAGTHGWVVSRRAILERDARKAARALVRSLEPGQRLKGRVTDVRDYGVLVDIGGFEGLVHQSEISWQRTARPADVAKPGDEVEVQVLKVGTPQRGQRGRQTKVSLSIKALLPDPWDEQIANIAEGSAQKGKVVRTTDFGAFIELAPGIEGLLHITQLGKDLKHASQAVDEGAEIDVVVERLDKAARRISLSRLSEVEAKALAEGTFDAGERPRSLKPGTHLKVLVEKVEHHGVTVRVAGVLGKRGRGYLPGRELGPLAEGEKRKVLVPGAEIEVKVVGNDRDGGLRCSVKALHQEEERRAVREYQRESSKQGFGTFGDLLRAKLGGD